MRRRRAMRAGVLVGLACGLGLMLLLKRRRQAAPPLALDSLGLESLSGEWFELAHGPESGSDRLGTRLQAGPDADGRLSLRGSWRPDSFDAPERHFELSLERARAGDAAGRFRIAGHDIWILALEPAGRWLIAGTPDRRRVWVLGRAPEFDAPAWEQIHARLRAQGFNPELLIRVPHLAPAEQA